MGRNGRSKKTHGSYISPGVSLEEGTAGARPIEAVGTSVAAFVGWVTENPKRAVAAGLVVVGVLGSLLRALRR